MPNREVEFYNDVPGTEQLIVVASTRHLDIDTSKYSKAGDFLSADTSQVENQFEEKGIRIRGPETNRQGDVVTRELTIRVTGQGSDRKTPGADSENNGQANVFISTTKERYALGERVRITFGADQKGWVHVYATEPDGTYSLLTQQPVDGQALQQVTARAESPTGDHKLVAVYTQTEQFDENLLDRIGNDKEVTKGLRLESGDTAIYAVRRFRIED